MRVIVSQQGKKLLIIFQQNKFTDAFVVDKAEEFLTALDSFIKKRKISPISLIGQIGHIEFKNTGMLTERVVRAIMLGLKFSYFKQN
ncbi:MAG: hypothetical protein Q8N43_01005 [Candidatus Azambacteria bacterium]|nr:hypothetical protein [Candidatus Azambacteria bacterium]